MEDQMWAWAQKLCECAGMNDAFFEDFRKRLEGSPAVMREFRHYYEKHDFLCEKKINGYTVIDIMIWKLDRFKSELDRDNAGKGNPDRMVLEAFDTMLCMEKEPEAYMDRLLNDTGTDYYGKY